MVRNPANGSISDEVWDASPTYSEFAIRSFYFFSSNVVRDDYSFPQDFFRDVSKCLHNVCWSDLFFLLVLSIGWTLLRRLMTVCVFEVSDSARIPSPCVMNNLPTTKIPSRHTARNSLLFVITGN
jgi:hypothetical protein